MYLLKKCFINIPLIPEQKTISFNKITIVFYPMSSLLGIAQFLNRHAVPHCIIINLSLPIILYRVAMAGKNKHVGMFAVPDYPH